MEEFEIALSARQYLYQLLWRTFSEEPNDEYIALLLDDYGSLAAEEAARAFGDAEATLSSAHAAMCDAAHDVDMQALASEYTRLFLGPGKLPAPPWASVYLGTDGIMFDASMLEVRNIYRRYGLLTEGYPKVADDHLATELSFMAAMSEKTLACLSEEKLDEAETLRVGMHDFLAEHVVVWLPLFTAQMREEQGEDGFYQQAIRLVETLIKLDEAWLGSVTFGGGVQ